MGKEALDCLRTTEPAEYLSPSSDLSRLARAASSHLYSSLLPFCPSKAPLDQLLSDESFDAEQIWSQIDLLSKPLLPFLRRNVSRLEKESKLQAGPALKSNGNAKCQNVSTSFFWFGKVFSVQIIYLQHHQIDTLLGWNKEFMVIIIIFKGALVLFFQRVETMTGKYGILPTHTLPVNTELLELLSQDITFHLDQIKIQFLIIN